MCWWYPHPSTDFHNFYHAIFSDIQPEINVWVKQHMLLSIFQLKSPFLNQQGQLDIVRHNTKCANIEKFSPNLKVEKIFWGASQKLG